jgi:hypothetical protein
MARIVIKDCLNCHVPHEWDFDAPTLRELRTIKKLTGLTGKGFAEASEESDPDAMAALIYVLHQRDKIKIQFDDVDLDFSDFEMIESEEEKELRELAEARENSGLAPKATE